MKLLMTADRVGGVWTYATELAAALAPLGVETAIAVLGPAGGVANASAPCGVIDTGLPLDWLADDPMPVRAAAGAIASLARGVGADLVQLNSPALAAARYPCPVIAVDHGTIAPWWRAAHGTPLPASFGWLSSLIREGLLAADAAVAPTAAYADEVARAYRLPRAPTCVHNGRAPAALPAAAPATAAFTAGRLWDRVKRTDVLDRVAARVPIRAAGPLVAPHGEAVAPRHLDLLGTLAPDALAAEYAQAPVFVSAASFEPFGLAVLEAAQAGCPLVLSDIATFRELWDGVARFVASDDPAAWAEAIADARADAAAGDTARTRAARYTPEATAGAMRALYGNLTRRAAA